MSLYSSLTQVLAPFAAKINGLLTGWDGTRYQTPGEAVRQQITDLHVLIGDTPGTAIQASAIAYGESDVDTALDDVNGRLQPLEGITDAQQVYPINLLNFNDPDFATGKLSTSTGLVTTSSTSRTTGFIPVEEGKTYNWIYGANIATSQAMSRVCAYDSSKNYLSSYTRDSVRGFTVPDDSGIAYVRFSGNGTYLVSTVQNNMFTKGFPSAYSEYVEPYTVRSIKNCALDMDAGPTPDSVKPVQSGGVYTALQSKQNMLTFDNEPTSGSNNPVKSGGIYDALAPVSEAISTELIASANLLNLNDPDVVLNKSISTSTGLPSGTANNLTATGFIPVTAGETYAIYYLDSFTQGIELRRVCYYDADKAYIANGYVDYVRSFTPPTGCSFVRIVANTANISTERHGILCVVGSVSEYVPYFAPYNKYAVKNTALDGDYIRTLGGTEQVFPEWELGSYNNSWNFTDSTTEIMSDYIPVGDNLKITVAEGYTAKVYPFYVTGRRGTTSPTTVTGGYVINSAETARYVRITLAKTTAETITDPNTYGRNIAIIRYGNQSTFNTHMSATPNAQDVVPSEVLPQYLALVAVKEKNVLGNVPVTVGYLYRTVTTPYKLYYAQGKPDNIKYLCDWDSSIAGATHNAPIWYSFGITDEGDIICVHRGEIEAPSSERIRDNPIVYPHTDYAHPVLVELTGTKPTSWISNCGNYVESGHFFFGEYIRSGHTEANVWDVSAPYTQAANWTVIKTYERDTDPSDPSTMVLGKIEHIHHVSRDPFSGILYVTTGDHHTEARIDYLQNGTWGILAEGDEEICRQLNFVYTPTYIYWASDAFSVYDPDTETMVGGAHKFFRAKRDANGFIDLDNLERYSIPYLSGSIATYHVAYVKDPECILILDRQDASSNFTELPFHVWDIKGERLEYAGQCKTARGSVAQFLGFRCECCQHYPNLYNSVISIGFSLYPNSIDVCGNPNPAIITSQGGVTSTDATNKNQVNSMTVTVSRLSE